MKILIIRQSSLGDVLHDMAIIHDILQHYPHAQIDWVVEEAYVDLLRLHSGIHRILPIAVRRWRSQLFTKNTWAQIRAFYQQLRSTEYDCIIDTQGLLKSGIVMGCARMAQGGKKIGLANATVGSGYEGISRIFHTSSVSVAPYTHAVERSRQLAAAALAYPLSGKARFDLHPPKLDAAAYLPQKPFIAFFHGTAGAHKLWPLENWQQLASKFSDWPIVLPWGNATEKNRAEHIALTTSNAIVLPQLNLLAAIQIAQMARLVVGLDSGLTHIAAAYETPTIELYCGSPRWKTEANWSDRVINLGDNGQIPDLASVSDAAKKLLSH